MSRCWFLLYDDCQGGCMLVSFSVMNLQWWWWYITVCLCHGPFPTQIFAHDFSLFSRLIPLQGVTRQLPCTKQRLWHGQNPTVYNCTSTYLPTQKLHRNNYRTQYNILTCRTIKYTRNSVISTPINVTRSSISRNPKERMCVVQISLLIVTFLSLISRILSLMQTIEEVNPHPRIVSCVNMQSVTFLFLFYFSSSYVTGWMWVHAYATSPGKAKWSGPHHTTKMLHFVLFHNVTCDIDSIVSRVHVNTTNLCNITCTLVAKGVILWSLGCMQLPYLFHPLLSTGLKIKEVLDNWSFPCVQCQERYPTHRNVKRHSIGIW